MKFMDCCNTHWVTMTVTPNGWSQTSPLFDTQRGMQASGLQKLTALTYLRHSLQTYTAKDMQSLEGLKQMRRLELVVEGTSQKGRVAEWMSLDGACECNQREHLNPARAYSEYMLNAGHQTVLMIIAWEEQYTVQLSCHLKSVSWFLSRIDASDWRHDSFAVSASVYSETG